MTTTTKIIIGVVVASAVIGGAYYFYKKNKDNKAKGDVLKDDKALPTKEQQEQYAKIPNFANPFGMKYKN